MEYEDYSLEDFLTDDYFYHWVKNPTAETKSYWDAWIASHPDKRDLINEAKEMLLALSTAAKQLSDQDKKRIWETVSDRKSAYIAAQRKNDGPSPKAKNIRRFYIFKIAAAVTVLLALGTASYYYYFNAPRTITYATRYDEVKKIVLPDSSRVFLNANSHLSFQEGWSKDRPREVTLQGEAYFEIVKTTAGKHQKFIVHAGQLQIEDLSTQFDVNNRRKKVKVMLREGQVRLIKPDTKGKDSLMMVPGDLVVYDSATSAFSRHKVMPDQFISWKDGIQTFNDTPLVGIAQTLEDTRGLKFVFGNDSLKDLRFTGRFEGNDLDSFLLILSKSFNIKITRKDNQITIGKK